MDTTTLSRLAAGGALAVALLAAPVTAVAVEEPVDGVEDAGAEEAGAEEGPSRRPMAETPRDRVGLFLLATLGAMGVAGGVTAVRQLSGKRPQTDGEFRWR